MTNLLYIALGGALGAVSRYLLSGWVSGATGKLFPFGTLLVNVIGCFFLGVVAHVAQTTTLIPKSLNTAVTIGFLGALTTFSTFGYETLKQIEDGAWGGVLANIAANVIVGIAAVWAGIVVGRILVGVA